MEMFVSERYMKRSVHLGIGDYHRLGVRDYIIKPFEDENLLSKVTRIITLERKPETDQPPVV
jgi:response regulator of citrate/malate metabolism